MSKIIYSEEFIKKVEYAFRDLPDIVKGVQDQEFMVGTAIFAASSFQHIGVEELLEFGSLEEVKDKASRILSRREVSKEWDDKFGKELLNLRYDIHDEE